MYSTKINFSKNQLRNLQKGKNVRLTSAQLGNGELVHGLDMATIKKIEKCKRCGKGMQFKMTSNQVGANPLLFSLLSTIAPDLIEGAVTGVSRLVRGKNILTGKGQKKTSASKKVNKQGNGMFLPGTQPRRRRGAGLSIPGNP